ncbi:hypothetical protein ACT3SZ_07440 [Corynebacterium sp. AOP40-9SA-29]|uniref:hypothetical protein n=1 Tax=Corynebacterium sp. AOP40-9SA-29 TaxID=3457677 RepID=UPI00403372A7
MSPEFRTLQQIQASVTPALPGRVVAAVLVAIFVGASSSPIAGPWTLSLAAVVMLIGAFALGLSLRAKGLRSNEYAPMRADDRTPADVGGTAEEPQSPNKRLRTMLSFAVPGIYTLMWIGQLIDSTTLGWIYAAVVTVVSLVVFWRVFVLEGARPEDYVALSTVFATEPDWSPSDDTDAVASTLYAAQAVPGGRQVRRDVLAELAAPLLSDASRDESLDAALHSLTARGLAVVLRERKDATTVVRWVTLTEEGRDALARGPVGATPVN